MNNNTILITGFEPFGGDAINPTQLILDKLPSNIGDFFIHKILLPVEFIGAPEKAINEYKKIKPQIMIMLGQAGGRSEITPELNAKNIMNARIPDNKGYQPIDEVIDPQGDEILHSTLPINKIVEEVNKIGIPCIASDHAGRYVCNTLFYRVLNENKGEVPTGFIHVPFIKEQGHVPYLEFDEIYRAIIKIIEVVINN